MSALIGFVLLLIVASIVFLSVPVLIAPFALGAAWWQHHRDQRSRRPEAQTSPAERQLVAADTQEERPNTSAQPMDDAVSQAA